MNKEKSLQTIAQIFQNLQTFEKIMQENVILCKNMQYRELCNDFSLC